MPKQQCKHNKVTCQICGAKNLNPYAITTANSRQNAKGACMVRGNAEYYRQLAQKRWEKKRGN
jgi:hypothetical protein